LNSRSFFTLLVVLVLSILLLSGPAGSAVRLERAGDRVCVVGGATFRDNGDVSGGDDDRWGDADPWGGDPEDPDEDGTGSGGEEEGSVSGTQSKPRPQNPLYQIRLILNWLLVVVSAR
jgi:hypothetical protein